MDDLTELQSRVAAAQERLQQSAEEERRYGLRLNDIVAIVEGSLARQRQELESLQSEVAQLQATVGRMSGERDEAKAALIQAHNALSAAQTRLGQREVQNEQLRRMLMELLIAIESHKGSAIPEVMRRLEGGIKTLMQQDADDAVEVSAEAQQQAAAEEDLEAVADEPEPEAAPEIAALPPAEPPAARPPVQARGRILTVVAKPAKVAETTGQLALATKHDSAEIAEQAAEEAEPAIDEPEAVADVAMSEAGDIVADPSQETETAAEPPAETAQNPKEQELVNALLDAEKRLIEAEALAGAAQANSPVAEIIRRISQRTREITDAGAPQS